MKKIILVLLVFMFGIGFVGCNNSPIKNPNELLKSYGFTNEFRPKVKYDDYKISKDEYDFSVLTYSNSNYSSFENVINWLKINGYNINGENESKIETYEQCAVYNANFSHNNKNYGIAVSFYFEYETEEHQKNSLIIIIERINWAIPNRNE